MTIEILNKVDLERFISVFAKQCRGIIAIDGEDGIGKTSAIAPCFAKSTSGGIISVDDFLKKDNSGYADFIDYKALKEKILKESQSKMVILEGVLLLKILEQLELKPDKFLYATAEDWFLKWGKYEEMGKDFNDIVRDDEYEIDRVDKMINPNKKLPYKLGAFRTEMYKYTFDYKPMEKADEILLFQFSDWWKER
jgi:hypothetical protein